MFSITKHQGNEIKKKNMRCYTITLWKTESSHTSLIGMKICTVSMETSTEVSQKPRYSQAN